MSANNQDDGVARDAWLSEALRHAPDADALPPVALSETILRQARAATALPVTPAARPAPSLGRRVLAVWSWLGRPPVAAGFASVMVAGVVGLMWWDRPLEEALPPRDATVPMAAPAPAPVLALPPAPAPAVVPPAAPPAPAPSPPARRPATQSPPPRVAAQAPAQPRTESLEASRQAEREPRPTEPAALADAAPPSGRAQDESQAAVAAVENDARAERRERGRSAAAAAKATAGAAPAAPAPFAASTLRRDAAPAPAAVGTLRSALVAQPDRWRWQREGTGPQALNGALERWLAQLDAATTSSWRPDPGTAAGDFATVQLWFDGRPHSTLRVDATGVVIEFADAAAARQRAELPAASAAALRAALDQATR